MFFRRLWDWLLTMLAPVLAVASTPPTPPPPAAVTSISVTNTSVPENIAAGANAAVLTTNLTVFGVSVDWVLAGTDAANWQLSASSGSSVFLQRSATGTLSEGVDENLTITAQRPGTDVYPDPAQDIVLTVTAPVTEVLLTTVRINNNGPATRPLGDPFSFGHPFARSDVQDGYSVIAKLDDGTPVPLKMELETYWLEGANADDSLMSCVFNGHLPAALNSGAALELNLYSSDTAPDRSATLSIGDVVTALLGEDDYTHEVEFDTVDDDDGVWIGSRNHALGGSLMNLSTGWGANPDRGYEVTLHNDELTEIVWFSKVALDPGAGSYHYQIRTRGVTRYHHASGLIQECAQTGLGNLHGAQGTHGETTWETKFPAAVRVKRGATLLREFLDSDTHPPVLPAAGAPWFGDAEMRWDWSDGEERELHVEWSTDYIFTTKVFPKFDMSKASSAPNEDDYVPGWRGHWPQDFHQTGDGDEDSRVGPVMWHSLAALKYPTNKDVQFAERKRLFTLFPTFQINEATGLAPVKGSTSLSYGPYGTNQRQIGRSSIWAAPSPACQYRDEILGGVWYARYQEGIIESSHWPNPWMYYARTGDTRARLTLQDHHLALMLNKGGVAGVDFVADGQVRLSNHANVDSGGTSGGYSIHVYAQQRGTGWAIRNGHMASLLSPYFHYDHSTAHQRTKWFRDWHKSEIDTMYALAVYENTNRGTWVQGASKHHYYQKSTNNGNDDAMGRVGYQNGSGYMGFMQAMIWRWIAMTDDIAAADAQEYWEWGLEAYHLGPQETGVACNYYLSNYAGWTDYYDNDPSDMPANLAERVQSTVEVYNGSVYSCPTGVNADSTGGYASIYQAMLGMNSQAGGGNYDADALYDEWVGLRSASTALKWSIGKVA